MLDDASREVVHVHLGFMPNTLGFLGGDLSMVQGVTLLCYDNSVGSLAYSDDLVPVSSVAVHVYVEHVSITSEENIYIMQERYGDAVIGYIQLLDAVYRMLDSPAYEALGELISPYTIVTCSRAEQKSVVPS